MTQTALAAETGVSRGTSSRYELWREPAGVLWRTARDQVAAAGGSEDDVALAVALIRDDPGPGWWDGHHGVPP